MSEDSFRTHTRNVRKLYVIDNDKVVGILTSSDLVKHIADH